MDEKAILDAMSEKQRQETMKGSDQTTLGQLTILLENTDGSKAVVFDDGEYAPTGTGSWRGRYAELALRYGSDRSDWRSVSHLLEMLRDADGSTFTGYKGGDFTMGQTTPIWVANRGESHGFDPFDGREYRGVVGVEEHDDEVAILTGGVPL